MAESEEEEESEEEFSVLDEDESFAESDINADKRDDEEEGENLSASYFLERTTKRQYCTSKALGAV